ncbi:ATP-binding protein [Marinomonas dokdonensis]|uniref:ATP-binding protein n=1 Tax=Marinomonas dokdonensis TaxID=328224 RepID=UPI004055565A
MNANFNARVNFTKSLLPISAFAIALLCSVAFFFIFSWYIEKGVIEEQSKVLQQVNHNSVTNFERRLNQSRNKINFLQALPTIHEFIAWQQVKPSVVISGNDSPKKQLEDIFLAFAQSNPEIRQIRLIGKENHGRELVRVERRGKLISSVSFDLLQEKGDEDYFREISRLSPNEIYISDITLNREYGVVENPIWPTYRIAKPLYDDSLNYYGFIIINIDASYLLNLLHEDFRGTSLSLFILNSKGHFVDSPFEEFNFGFDLDKPEITWQQQTQETGLPLLSEVLNVQLLGGKGYYIVASKQVLSTREGRSIYLISAVDEDNVAAQVNRSSHSTLYLMLVIFLLVIGITYAYQRQINRRLSLHDDKSRYQAIIAGSSDAIISTDKSGKILSWNESASYLFGLNEDQAKKKKIFEFIRTEGEEQPISESLLKDIISAKRSVTLEVQVSASFNTLQILSINLSPVVPSNSAIAPTVAALIRDITESRKNEQQIVAINDSLEKQVEERTQQLELATQEAMKANETKSAFVANISHEIRNPLNGIGGMLELLNREQLSQKQLGYLNMAKGSVSTLTVLINDLLDLTKMESGKLDIAIEPMNIIETVSDVVSSMSMKAQEKGLTLYLDCTKAQCEHLNSDSYRIKQILINLLGNAFKFTERGSVSVKLSSYRNRLNDNRVIMDILVTDTGIGISLDQQQKLFKPFTQANNSIAKKFGGTGLGLSICKQLAHLLDGDIQVNSVVNQGSTFSLSLQADLDKHTEPKAVGPLLLGVKCHILLEDKNENAILVSQFKAWKAEVTTGSRLQELYNLQEQALPQMLVLESSMVDASFMDWFAHSVDHHKCKLLLVNSENQGALSSLSGLTNVCYLDHPVLPIELLSSYSQMLKVEEAPSWIPIDNDVEHKADNKQMFYQVLVVDDNEINRFVAQGLLEKYPIQVHNAKNGADAISLIQSLPDGDEIDLILMDCQMPVMNGFETTELIRQGAIGDKLKHIPIVAMTAGAMSGDRDSCLESGMDDFIAKPLEPASFEKKVMQWLEQNA